MKGRDSRILFELTLKMNKQCNYKLNRGIFDFYNFFI